LPGSYMGCGTADIDNDGAADIFVSGYGVNRLFRNVRNGRFEDATRRAGLEAGSATEWNSAVAFGDYDQDGWVDLYVGKYLVFNPRTLQFCDYGGIRSSCGPKFYDAQTGALYRNHRDGTFRNVTRAVGLSDQHGKTLGAIFADYDGD